MSVEDRLERSEQSDPVAGQSTARPSGGGSGRPVFLVGAARSGTSLLFKVMAAHPDAAWTSNWVQRYPWLTPLAGLNRLARRLPDRRSRVWFGAKGDNAYSYGRRRPNRDRMFPMPAEAESLYLRCGIPELDTATADDASVARLRKAARSITRWSGGRTFLNKRIANNRRIPLLLQAFPDALFIEIVRDGRAVAASLAAVDWWEGSDVWWYGGTPAQWREQGGDPWELCGRNWVEEVVAVRSGLAEVPADQVLSLRYEQLIQDPIGVTRTAMAFAGLSPDSPEWTAALSNIRFPNKNERWRNALNAQALATVERVQREELRGYGYLDRPDDGQRAHAEPSTGV